MNIERALLTFKATNNLDGLKVKILQMVFYPILEYYLYTMIITTITGSVNLIVMMTGLILNKMNTTIRINLSNSVRFSKQLKVTELEMASPTSFLLLCIDKMIFFSIEALLFLCINMSILIFLTNTALSIHNLINLFISSMVTLLSGISLSFLLVPIALPLKNANLLLNLTTSLIFIFSGCIVSTDKYPSILRLISTYFPTRNGIVAARASISGEFDNSMVFSELKIAIVCLLLSIVLYRFMEKTAKKNGGIMSDF
ncbi:ABC transporter permease [Enterococcus ureasiticus]|uniref:ABC transporter permease n=1 Tax=Enterococcus ureasiticus TaxID=903984 RepID=UPI0009FEA123|nr:ABC transporter permease [Enterococcus ureasiticus]